MHVLIDMLRWLGAGVEFQDGVMQIDPTTVDKYQPPYDLSSRMRASYYLAPVLLAFSVAPRCPMPGGCDIGARPIDQTIKGMTALGADVRWSGGVLYVSTMGLSGSEVYLGHAQRGALR